jgi:hypothetical protein
MKLALLFAALIFQPGEGIFRESAPRQTEGWVGLYCNGTCALLPASLEYVVDARDEQRLDAASRPRGALFVFRDVPGVVAGPVAEAPYDWGWPYEKTTVPLILNGDRYELSVTSGDQFLNKAVITLRHGEVTQVIFRMPEFVDEAHVELHFAGDLDHDGRLDLIMTNSPKYSYHPVQLYLSSAAKNGELVGEISRWDHYGC